MTGNIENELLNIFLYIFNQAIEPLCSTNESISNSIAYHASSNNVFVKYAITQEE